MKRPNLLSIVLLPAVCFSFSLKAQTEEKKESGDKWRNQVDLPTNTSITSLNTATDGRILKAGFRIYETFSLPKFSIFPIEKSGFQKHALLNYESDVSVTVKRPSEASNEKVVIQIQTKGLSEVSKNLEITNAAGEKITFDPKDVSFDKEAGQLEVKLAVGEGLLSFSIPTTSGVRSVAHWVIL